MKNFLKNPNILIIILTVLFCVVIAVFCFYDSMAYYTDRQAYTGDDIHSLKIEMVNINTADISELTALPSIGESTAQKIIDYREKNGDFKSKEELMEVESIGKKTYLQILPYIEI